MDETYDYFMSDSVFGLGSIPWGVGQFAATPILQLDTKYSQETESFALSSAMPSGSLPRTGV